MRTLSHITQYDLMALLYVMVHLAGCKQRVQSSGSRKEQRVQNCLQWHYGRLTIPFELDSSLNCKCIISCCPRMHKLQLLSPHYINTPNTMTCHTVAWSNSLVPFFHFRFISHKCKSPFSCSSIPVCLKKSSVISLKPGIRCTIYSSPLWLLLVRQYKQDPSCKPCHTAESQLISDCKKVKMR